MAQILGNLVPEDDYTHRLGPEPNFNESMYFNFFDPQQSIGGFVRLGNRANEGRAEMTLCLYLQGGRVLFQFQRAPIDDNDAFDAGGMRFEVVKPSDELRTTYRGSAVDLADPSVMADPAKAFEQNPKRRIALDLRHRATGPMYGGTKNQEETDLESENQFAKAHYEQHMAVSGTLEIDGEAIQIDGYGLRDHSWGPRHWQAIQSYDWLTMNFGPDFGAMVSIIRRDAENQRRGGVIVRDGELKVITEVSIEVEYEANDLYHRALDVAIKTHEGEDLQIRGEVKGFIPLRNRRAGLLTHIGEGMTEWRCGDRIGYGLSEFLRQVE